MSELAAGDCKTLPGTYEPMNYQSLMTWIKAVRILALGLVVLIVSCLFTCFSIAINKLYGLCVLLQFLIRSLTLICWHESQRKYLSLSLDCVCIWQGEEGPPSLEYIKAKDLFPQKELVKEDESLQVSDNHFYSTVPSALTPSNMTSY